MQNIDVKVLKYLAGAIAVVLFIMVIVINKFTAPPKEKEIIVLDAVNNGERVVYYSGDIYCSTKINKNGKIENVLMRLSSEFDDSTPREILKTCSSSVENIKLNFFENRLLYNDSLTYIYDLQKQKADMFCEGELQFFIEPDGFIMLQNGDLYKVTYYASTYMANNFERIATGDFKRQGEDEEKVYYSSETGKSNTIIVALDKESLEITTLDNINTLKQSVEKIEVTDEYIYVFVKGEADRYIRRVSKELGRDGTAEIEKIPIEYFDKIETIPSKYARPLNLSKGSKFNKKDKFNDIYFYGSVIDELGERYGKQTTYKTKMYKYSIENNTVTEYDGILNELHTKSYSGDFNGTKVELYYGDKKVTEIETGVPNLNNIVINDIEIIEHDKEMYLYYEIRVSEIAVVKNEETQRESRVVKYEDVILGRTLLEGGTSQRINIKQ